MVHRQFDRARLQHLGAQRCHFEHFFVGDFIEFLGRLHIARLLDLGQQRINLLVLVMERLVLADLVEVMFQWLDKQVVFRLGMRFQQSFRDPGQRLHFRHRPDVWQHSFDMIEQVVEHGVFRP